MLVLHVCWEGDIRKPGESCPAWCSVSTNCLWIETSYPWFFKFLEGTNWSSLMSPPCQARVCVSTNIGWMDEMFCSGPLLFLSHKKADMFVLFSPQSSRYFLSNSLMAPHPVSVRSNSPCGSSRGSSHLQNIRHTANITYSDHRCHPLVTYVSDVRRHSQ